ncbi:hypothetical protein MC885_010298, partial [Smutsia gigantea]
IHLLGPQWNPRTVSVEIERKHFYRSSPKSLSPRVLETTPSCGREAPPARAPSALAPPAAGPAASSASLPTPRRTPLLGSKEKRSHSPSPPSVPESAGVEPPRPFHP